MWQHPAKITTIPIFTNAPTDGDVEASPMYRLILEYARDINLRKHFADVLAGLDAGSSSVFKKMANNLLNPSETNTFMRAAHEAAGGAAVNIAQEEEVNEDAHGNSETLRQTNFTAEGAPPVTLNEQHVAVHITPELMEARLAEMQQQMLQKMQEQKEQYELRLKQFELNMEGNLQQEVRSHVGERMSGMQMELEKNSKIAKYNGELVLRNREKVDKAMTDIAAYQRVTDKRLVAAEKKVESTTTSMDEYTQAVDKRLAATDTFVREKNDLMTEELAAAKTNWNGQLSAIKGDFKGSLATTTEFTKQFYAQYHDHKEEVGKRLAATDTLVKEKNDILEKQLVANNNNWSALFNVSKSDFNSQLAVMQRDCAAFRQDCEGSLAKTKKLTLAKTKN